MALSGPTRHAGPAPRAVIRELERHMTGGVPTFKVEQVTSAEKKSSFDKD
jgi:hypothetical protein